MMEAAPAASLVMPEAEFLFQVLVIALDPPAQLDQIDECSPCDVGRQGREPVFDRLLLAAWPFDQQPFFGARRRPVVIAMRGTNPHGGEARSEFRVAALAPGHTVPGVLGQACRQVLGRDRRTSITAS